MLVIVNKKIIKYLSVFLNQRQLYILFLIMLNNLLLLFVVNLQILFLLINFLLLITCLFSISVLDHELHQTKKQNMNQHVPKEVLETDADKCKEQNRHDHGTQLTDERMETKAPTLDIARKEVVSSYEYQVSDSDRQSTSQQQWMQ